MAVTDDVLQHEATQASREEGVDFSPEGGAGLAAARVLLERGQVGSEDRVVVFNTGAGWLYRSPGDLLPA